MPLRRARANINSGSKAALDVNVKFTLGKSFDQRVNHLHSLYYPLRTNRVSCSESFNPVANVTRTYFAFFLIASSIEDGANLRSCVVTKADRITLSTKHQPQPSGG